MKKEELLSKKFKNKKELDASLRAFFDFKKPTNEERRRWPYKLELNVSLDILKGKECFVEEVSEGVISEVVYVKHKGRNIIKVKTEKGMFSLTKSSIKIYNKLYDVVDEQKLHPTRSGAKLFTNGFLINERQYKSMYYNTVEYREKYEFSLNKSLGTIGLKAPIQHNDIKDKISNTIKKRYGQNWFLCRGGHYSAVTNTMISKYGVENLFFDYEWQMDNVYKINTNFKESSNLELDIINEINTIIKEDDVYFKGSKNGQKVVPVDDKRFYKLDYYNKKYNLVIEIMGDYWHCNPEKYKYDFYHKNKRKTANQIWTEDLKRKNEIINILGCKLIEIWEKNWLENKENIINFIKEEVENENF